MPKQVDWSEYQAASRTAAAGGVTGWRPVVNDAPRGRVPLFDMSNPSTRPWTEVAAATGSRHHPPFTAPAGTAGTVDPPTGFSAAGTPARRHRHEHTQFSQTVPLRRNAALGSTRV